MKIGNGNLTYSPPNSVLFLINTGNQLTIKTESENILCESEKVMKIFL